MTAISIEVIIKLCMTLKKYGNFEIYFARTFPFTLIIFYSLFFCAKYTPRLHALALPHINCLVAGCGQ